MVIINGKELSERPGMCCTCPFYSDGSKLQIVVNN